MNYGPSTRAWPGCLGFMLRRMRAAWEIRDGAS
jgi:hypothetical protein